MRITQEQFTIVGLPLRTNNREAASAIPPHWESFVQADVAGSTGAGGDVYAVYADHEHAGVDNLGDYTLVIGHRVPDGTVPPEGLAAVVVPRSDREIVELEPGRPDLVGEAWQRIWAREDLDLSYLADFERYAADGGIEISPGLRSAS
ncbi:GyrI-like domain-containing protein [Microbacterium aurantiacum]|uniref:GyrI-like domain-containing protein n=1 Tax=Microbacterium aurantiacum TaxID=162393 RepID=UPI000C810519|nr:GyrI-like domain-containing protein [Microbacterium aurantiacum]